MLASSPTPNLGGVMKYVSIIFFTVLVLFSFGRTQAEINQTIETSMMMVQSSPKHESAGVLVSEDVRIATPIAGPPLLPVNLCLGGTVADESSQRGHESADPFGLLRVIDGDLGTFVMKKDDSPGWLKVNFGWHPRWINKVKIARGGAGPYQVEYQDLVDSWHVVGIHSEAHPLGAVVHYDTFDFEPVKAKAVRWRSSENTPIEREGYEICEIEAYFLQVDDDDGQWEIGVEWVNDYPGLFNDLAFRDDDAQDLYNTVGEQPGWVKSFECGNAGAWERDFTHAGLGGQENDMIDRVDIAYFSGHGSNGCANWDPAWESRRHSLEFGRGLEDEDLHLVPGEGGRWLDGTHSWGDIDLEWLGFSACQLMRDHRYWANCLNGLHLILGWQTDSREIGDLMPGRMPSTVGLAWAEEMLEGRTIIQAWFNAADRTHWDPEDGPWIAGAVGEERDNLNDHLWGVGSVGPDPVPDRWYCYWTFRASKEKEGTEGELLSKWFSDSSDPLVLLPHPNGKGKPVKYKSSVLSSVQETTMVQYYVVPRSVDSVYIQNIAYNMCAVESVMCCTTQVESDGAGHLWMICGSEELQVSEASGGVQYINSGWWMIPPDVSPTLPQPSWAWSLANGFLTEMMMKPPDSSPEFLRLAHLDCGLDKETGKSDQDSSMYTSIMVSYRREMTGGYQVTGPGAVLNVTYGDNDRLERWAVGGWRDITPGPEVSVITVEEAMELIATEGSDATIGGIPLCDTLVVTDAELAYYEENGDVVQDQLEIIWALTCMCLTEYDTTETEIYVPARFLPPKGSIDTPPDSSWFPEGEAIIFSGSAIGGVTPYTFDWYSDVDGYLGSGEIITINTLSSLVRDGTVIPHTITLTVTDLNGMSDHVNISVFVGFMRGDANGDWIIDIGDVIYLINYLFTGTSAPDPLWVGDCNCDEIVDIGDVIYLINYLFTGTSPPGCP